MRAAVFHGREDLRLEDVPEPAPGAGEIKLRVLFNGICGSDLHEYYDGPITTRVTPASISLSLQEGSPELRRAQGSRVT